MDLASLPTLDSAFAASGLAVGLLVGMTGVGGGSLMTPLLILLFGIHPMTAVGTDLLQASVTKAFGSAIHGANRTVDWRIVRRLLTGSLPATAATILALRLARLDAHALGHLVSLVLGAALLLTAAAIVLRPWLVRAVATRLGMPGPRATWILTVVTGAVMGVLVSISSVGAGAIGVSVLILLYPSLRITRVVGSDIAHAVPLTLLAGLGHWSLGSIDWHLLVSLLAGSIPGIVAGSLLAVRVPEGATRALLATMLTLVGARLIH